METVLNHINSFVWGVPTLVLILGVGAYFSITTGFSQLTLLPRALRNFILQFKPKRTQDDSVSPFQALCTALAATVGTGNIAGVAGAIALGGPGAVFWMWISALLGMMTKFAEAALAVRFRSRAEDGSYLGGPMYMIRNAMGSRWAWMAGVYSFFGIVAAFGVGNATQINAVISSANTALTAFGVTQTRVPDLLIAVTFAILAVCLLLGGAKRIGSTAEKLVPFAAVAYLLLGLGVLLCNADKIPGAFCLIMKGAFSPRSVTGGVVGSLFTSLRAGVSRGVFTNEAGMGTASIAHASAQTAHPVEQGLMGVVEVFLDTIVICTMTALVILCSPEQVVYGFDEGAALTVRAFAMTYGEWVSIPIAIFLCCFAFATMLGWGFYGARCAEYLFGKESWRIIVYLQGAVVVVSTVLSTGTVWLLSEVVNALMAIPNLLVLFALRPELKRLICEYKLLDK